MEILNKKMFLLEDNNGEVGQKGLLWIRKDFFLAVPCGWKQTDIK